MKKPQWKMIEGDSEGLRECAARCKGGNSGTLSRGHTHTQWRLLKKKISSLVLSLTHTQVYSYLIEASFPHYVLFGSWRNTADFPKLLLSNVKFSLTAHSTTILHWDFIVFLKLLYNRWSVLCEKTSVDGCTGEFLSCVLSWRELHRFISSHICNHRPASVSVNGFVQVNLWTQCFYQIHAGSKFGIKSMFLRIWDARYFKISCCDMVVGSWCITSILCVPATVNALVYLDIMDVYIWLKSTICGFEQS